MEVAPFDPSRGVDPVPFNPRQKQNIDTFLNNWSAVSSKAGNIDQGVIQSVQDYDARRVLTGSSPLSKQAASLAILAGMNRKAQTESPEPERGILETIGNIPSDVVNTAKALPQLVGHLASQIIHPVDTFNHLTNPNDPRNAAAMKRSEERGFGGDNPEPLNPAWWADLFQGASELPILELVPGLRTLSAILPGGIAAGEMADHPVGTALDVLPFASKLARSHPVVEAADAALPEAIHVRRPLTTLAAKTLDSEGNLVQRPAAAWMEQNVASTKVGNFLRTSFGQKVRMANLTGEDLRSAQLQALTTPKENLIQPWIKKLPQYPFLRDMHDLVYKTAETYGVDQVRATELADVAAQGRPNALAALPDNEFALVQKWRDVADGLGELDAATKDLIRDPLSNELYTARKGGLILNRESKLQAAKAKFTEEHQQTIREASVEAGANHKVAQMVDALDAGDYVKARELITDMSRTKGNAFSAPDPARTSALTGHKWMKQFESTVGVREAQVNAARDALEELQKPRTKGRKVTPLQISKAEAKLAKAIADHETSIVKFKNRYNTRVQKWMANTPDMDPRLVKMWSNLEAGSDDAIALGKREAEQAALNSKYQLPEAPTFADVQPLRERFSTANMRELFGDPKAKTPMSPGQGQTRVLSVNKFGKMKAALDDIVSKEATLAKTRERAVPSRFQPAVREGVKGELISRATPETFAEVSKAIEEKRYSDALIPDAITANSPDFNLEQWRSKEIAKIVQEQSEVWQQLKEAGYDPVFLHQVASDVNPNRLVAESFGIGKPSHLKERTVLDLTPYHHDFNVGLTHQMMGSLNQIMGQKFHDSIAAQHGVSAADVEARIAPRATRQASHGQLTFQEAKQAILKREYSVLDPEAMFGIKTPNVLPNAKAQLYVPKYLGDALIQMGEKRTGVLTSVVDPVTGLFRLSTTAFSPRAQLNNMVGNLAMTLLEHPSALLQVRKAYQLNKGAIDLVEALKGAATPDEITRVIESSSYASHLAELGATQRDMAELQWAGGNTIRRLLREHDSPLARGMMRGADKAGAVTDFAGKVADKSMTFNGWVDDLNKSILFLSETSKKLKAGAPGEAAAEAGIALSRKVAMQWKMLTPFERSVIRPLVPFYSFQRHMFAYAMSFPFDHPIRASIISNLAGAEREDNESGYPELFSNAFFLNSTGKANATDRDQNAVYIGGMNPFNGLGSTFGLLGFISGDSASAGEALSGANPIIKTLMQTVGFDPRAGTADLYPDLAYDPASGGLVYKSSSNPLLNLVGNIIPQTTIISNLLGASADYEDMARKNPAAARRSFLTGAGIPVLWRSYDVPAEYGKTELVRNKAQKDALSAGLKSGNWDDAARFPGNRPTIDALKQLQQENPAAIQQYVMAPTPDSRDALHQQLLTLSRG